MFQRTAQTNKERAAALAHDYANTIKRQNELRAEVDELRAQPLAVGEQVRILRAALERSRHRYESMIDERLEAILNDPFFDATDPAQLDRLDLVGIMGHPNAVAWKDACAALMADSIIQHVELRARMSGADRSKLTLAKRQTELARLESELVEVENARQSSLNGWRSLTGDMMGYPTKS